MFPMFLTFLADFNLQKLPSRRLEVLWELNWVTQSFITLLSFRMNFYLECDNVSE